MLTPKATRIRPSRRESASIGIGILLRGALQKCCRSEALANRLVVGEIKLSVLALRSKMHAMCRKLFRGIHLVILLSAAMPASAQDIATLVTTTNRSPSSVADHIADPDERAAFLSLYQGADAAAMLQAAKSFLEKYPQSAFLAQAYEVAADSSFDQADYRGGLAYARQSLVFLPENPQLLVGVADVQAREHLNEEAIVSARAALCYFERFGRPGAISEGKWPQKKRAMQATANAALGRASLQKALDSPSGEKRSALLRGSVEALEQAHALNAADSQIAYLLGLARLSSGDGRSAAKNFAEVYGQKGDLAPKALDHLQTIYKSL